MKQRDLFADFVKGRDYKSGLKRFNELLLESDEKYDFLIPSLFHPYILRRGEFQEMKRQTERMAALLTRISDIYIKDKSVAEFYDFPEEINEWISYDPGYSISVPISRYDGFWDGEIYRFCEFNTDGTSGLNDMTVLDSSFLQTQLGGDLSREYSLLRFNLPESILNTLLETYKDFGGQGKPSIAIADYQEKSTKDEFRYLKEYFITRGYETEICDLRSFELKPDGLWNGSFKVDVVYRRAVTDDIFTYIKDSGVFLEACRKRAVCVVGPLRSHVIHSKKTFLYLNSDLASAHFTEEELSFIRERIPWTKSLTDTSLDFSEIIRNKDEYFLKPHNSYAAKGVFCGMDMNHEEWKKTLDECIATNTATYLLQRKIEIPVSSFYINESLELEKFNVKLDPYLFRGVLCGFYARISGKNIISLNREGMLLPCFVSGE